VEDKKEIVILPTFNEANNIAKIIKRLHILDIDILVVDDNSPDNTATIVKKLMLSNKRIDILQRPKKLGLGSAYRDGFKYSIKKGYKNIIQMDADFSHRIEDLKAMLNSINDYEVIIGSRYVNGGDSIGWSSSRKLLSKFANIFARKVTGCKINDMTSGFRVYSSNALKTIQYNATKSNGYGFQIEMSVKAYNKKLSIVEIPIIFNERREGESKMNFKIIIEALFIVLKLRFIK
jgi:dolichol-phosphate mannosyltransferase